MRKMISEHAERMDKPSLFVVGAGSRIFQALPWNREYVAVSGRADSLKDMPSFPRGATILIFADPPTAESTVAMLASVVGSSSPGSGTHVILISSISALFDKSDLFPGTGAYSTRKRLGEQFLTQSTLSVDVSILRLGNVFECGNWRDVTTRYKTILLPRTFDKCAVSHIAALHEHLLNAIDNRKVGAFSQWTAEPVDTYFDHIRILPGLIHLYRSKLGRLMLKVAARPLRKARVYLPSPDDIDSFNPNFLRGMDK